MMDVEMIKATRGQHQASHAQGHLYRDSSPLARKAIKQNILGYDRKSLNQNGGQSRCFLPLSFDFHPEQNAGDAKNMKKYEEK